MTTISVTWAARLPEGTTRVILPRGLATPEAQPTGVAVTGGQPREIREETTGQLVLDVTPDARDLSVQWRFAPTPASYPDGLFVAHPSRHTRAADALLAEVAGIAPDMSGLDRARAIACATAERFTYGHPATRFTDGHDAVPALGCGLTEGSCVDINTYFLAALRSVGFDAAYVTGFFFPAEKQGRCDDGHCWVLTRIEGQVQAWDIAHHLKMGTRDIRPALNPKPGVRVACFHGMGLRFAGLPDLKALIEPVCLADDRQVWPDRPDISLSGIDMAVPA